MSEVVRWQIRYRTPCKTVRNGRVEEKVTREEYAERFNATIPDEPDIPEIAAHVWQWFWALSERRSRGFDSPNPLTYLELDAWLRLTRNYVLPEEIDMIWQMDQAWLAAVAEVREEQRDK